MSPMNTYEVKIWIAGIKADSEIEAEDQAESMVEDGILGQGQFDIVGTDFDEDTDEYEVYLKGEIWLENSRDPNEYLDRLKKTIRKENKVTCEWR
jgi:hypothetical protein